MQDKIRTLEEDRVRKKPNDTASRALPFSCKYGLPWRQADSGTNAHDPVDGDSAEIFTGGAEFSHYRGGPRADERGSWEQSPLQAHGVLQALRIPEQGVLPPVFGAEPAAVFLPAEEAAQLGAARPRKQPPAVDTERERRCNDAQKYSIAAIFQQR